ncbi:hypothetical protein LOCC1_G000448 [Lachnellula occidentalis]|uniref:Something about silencing protein 4 domain-containing protein n=1 Tax=Lachnellula occidentalis TaxID=215460 RepID=A0A8H8S9L5_9HELO|nr:hypothetical protein LOCC1_G000448 [Lachnellula occidentalis]
MASSPFTRSSRKTEGLTTRSSTRSNVVAIPSYHNNAQNRQRQQPPNIGRRKRPRDALDHDDHPIEAKKARITVEITSKPRLQPKTRSLVITTDANSPPPPAEPQRFPSPPPRHVETATQTPAPPPLQLQQPQQPSPTVHHQKVVNGIKHELDRLQPKAADLNKDEKRKLRSQEGTRFKSELSQYFPEYDEVIGNDPKEDHILNLDTPIIIVDSAKTSKQPSSPKKPSDESHAYPLKDFPDSLFDDIYNAERRDYTFLLNNQLEEGAEDPLSDAYFESIHRKPERQEKQIRNGDRGRAQHEKDQVIRLLEGLQGHDWLKLMGVSGITDSRRKEYEPARDHFIKGCENILEKFRIWREEEKRRKLEKEQALAQVEAAEEEVVEGVDEADEDDAKSDGDPPDYSDVDASAARQLHDEAIARSAPLAKRHAERMAKVEMIPPIEYEKEFRSFFPKPHLRQAALGKHRRSGRSVSAWGHPVPEVPVEDFDLPEEYRDEETLKIHARRKRRDRRISKP